MGRSNVLVGQSGGPTSVINSSLCGVIERAASVGGYGTVLGMRYGIEGFLQEWLVDLGREPPDVVAGLRSTPGSALGSSRHKLTDPELPRIRELLEKHDVGTLFLIGGNDTMDTVHRIERYCRETRYPLTGIGIPKTVDNDLYGTDHTPGYGSAARYIAQSVQQGGRLADDMQKVDRFVVFQTIGRDAGWLAAASALARKRSGDAPHLIYLPERPVNRAAMLDDVRATIDRLGWCFVVVGEGAQWDDGTLVSASTAEDEFSNVEFGAMGGSSAAINMHAMISARTGYRGEFQITESLPMCAIDRASGVDLEEAYRSGEYAVDLARDGQSGVMVAMERVGGGEYAVRYTTAGLEEVAARSKPLPDEFIDAAGNGATEEFIRYASPLVGELPTFSVLGEHSDIPKSDRRNDA